jgi:hypothetical protein
MKERLDAIRKGLRRLAKGDESMRRLKHVQLVTGLLSRDATGPFGFSAKAKAKLVRWFPSAQIQIW